MYFWWPNDSRMVGIKDDRTRFPHRINYAYVVLAGHSLVGKIVSISDEEGGYPWGR